MHEQDSQSSRPEHPLPYVHLLRELAWANRTVIAASSAAVVGIVAGYPFDSVKTRLQTQPYSSISHCIRHTYKEEGVRGFFRGILPPLVTVSIIKSISFSVYENTKTYCKTNYSTLSQDTLLSTMAVSTIGGTVSGAFIATLSCPLELVKIQRQLEHLLQASSISTGVTVMRSIDNRRGESNVKQHHSTTPLSRAVASMRQAAESSRGATSSWTTAKEIVLKRGFLGLYSGFRLHFVRDAIGTGVYFGGYETTKFLLTGNGQQAGPLTQFLAGGVCGILCWIVVFPVDLVKSIIQKEVLCSDPSYKSTSACVRDIYRRQGLAGFYRGITVTLVRAFPIHSLNFLVYEQTLLLVRYLSHHHEHVSL